MKYYLSEPPFFDHVPALIAVGKGCKAYPEGLKSNKTGVSSVYLYK